MRPAFVVRGAALVRDTVRLVRESPQVQATLILGTEWLLLTAVVGSLAPVNWLTALQVGSLVVVALWLPIHLLIVRPLGMRAGQAERRAQAYEGATAEREMMMGIVEESEARLRAIVNNSPNGIVVLDADTTCPIDFNDTLPRLLGYSRAEFADLPMGRYVIDDAAESARSGIERAVRGSDELFTCLCRTRTGGTFDAQFSAQVVTVNGQPAVSCIVRDISQEREAERALRLTHDRMQSMISELERRNRERTVLTELGSVLQACVNLSEAYTAISRFGPRLFQGAGGALYLYSHSRTDLELVASWNEPAGGFDQVIAPVACWGLRKGQLYDRIDAANLACEHAEDGGEAPYLCAPLTAQGETIGVLHLRAVCIAPSPGTPASVGAPEFCVDRPLMVTVCDQITLGIANLRLRETLRQQSILDPLTGLYNRRYMEESLRREIPRAGRTGRPLAVIMADLDHFKRFNDTFGHEAGDVVLTELGQLLKGAIRASDIACRYGGEEFALVLPDTTREGTIKRVEAIRARVTELHVRQRGRSLGGLTLSIGIALLPDHGSTPEDLLRSADAALYRAKAAGRDRAEMALSGEDVVG
jgi:diguanylate cyclase (GGDEF)-like protein/PAS domain S-box-containing protein